VTSTVEGRTGAVVPGRMFGPYQPLLFYAGEAAQSRGATVEFLDWRPPASIDPPTDSVQRQAWVLDEVAPVLDRLGGTPLLIGKSLGSYAAELAARRRLPAVWYTPLLLDGGTADVHAWHGDLARSLTPYVCQIEGADHGLAVPGPVAGWATVLGEVTAAVERFLDDVVWPS
jgi:hypothetical protein